MNDSTVFELKKHDRLLFARRHESTDWSKAIFIDVNKFGRNTLRIFNHNKSHKLQYISFLNEVIVPMWMKNRDLIFFQNTNKFSHADLTRSWCTTHRGIPLLNWPIIMDMEYPFTDIWFNLNHSFENESIYDPNIIISHWLDVKEDLHDFQHPSNDIKNCLQKVINVNGSMEYTLEE